MSTVAVFQNLGLPELIIILAILLLLFGATRLPKMARSLGKSAKEFKAGLKEGGADADDEEEEEPSSESSAEKRPPE